MTMESLCAGFGVGSSTAGNKAADIRKMLKFRQSSAEYSLRALIKRDVLIWTASVNGVVTDIRHAPRDAQEALFAFGRSQIFPTTKTETRPQSPSKSAVER